MTAPAADAGHIGRPCPFCRFPLKQGASLVSCPACRAVHHSECWTDNGGCAVMGCAAAATVTAAAAPAPAPPASPPRRSGLVIALSLLVLVLMGAVAALALSGSGAEEPARQADVPAPAASAPPAEPSASPEATETPEPSLTGRWRGTGTQYAASGTTQRVTIRVAVGAGERSGTMREHVVGEGHESFCRGTLTRTRAANYLYRDEGSDCLPESRVRLRLASGVAVDFLERYRVPSGRTGRVVARLRRG